MVAGSFKPQILKNFQSCGKESIPGSSKQMSIHSFPSRSLLPDAPKCELKTSVRDKRSVSCRLRAGKWDEEASERTQYSEQSQDCSFLRLRLADSAF